MVFGADGRRIASGSTPISNNFPSSKFPLATCSAPMNLTYLHLMQTSRLLNRAATSFGYLSVISLFCAYVLAAGGFSVASGHIAVETVHIAKIGRSTVANVLPQQDDDEANFDKGTSSAPPASRAAVLDNQPINPQQAHVVTGAIGLIGVLATWLLTEIAPSWFVSINHSTSGFASPAWWLRTVVLHI